MKKYQLRKGICYVGILMLALVGCSDEDDDDYVVEINTKAPVEETVATTEETTEKEKIVVTTQEDSGNTVKPEKTPNSSDTEAKRLSDLEASISAITSGLQSSGATVSVFVKQLDSGDYADLSVGQMKSASLIKLFVAGTVYVHQADLKAQESNEGEVDALLTKMITVSDNDATNRLVKMLGNGDAQQGIASVNKYCEANGFTGTSMGRLMLDFNAANDNYTTVSDCARFIRECEQGELAGGNQIIDLMKQQERTGKIPAGVPSGVTTGNKTGELDDVENDAAIVYAESGTYILCVMTGNLTDTETARNKITAISETVYKYMQDNY